MSYVNVFTTLGESLDNAFNSFIADKMGQVVSVATPIALAGVSLYITIYGYLIIAGRVQQPFQDFAIKAIKIILVAACSIGANYGDIASSIEGFQSDMVSAMGGGTSVYSSLDQLADKGFETLEAINQKNSSLWFNQTGAKIGYWIMFAVVAAAYLIILIGLAVTIIIPMIFLKILLALGPIFIMCLMFPPVARFFDNWFGAVMSNVFTTVIAAAFAVICIKIFQTNAGVIDVNHSSINPWTGIFGIMAMSVILFLASRSIASLSAGLGGGVASEMLSAGQALSHALGLTPTPRQNKNISDLSKGGWKAGKKTYSWVRSKIKGQNAVEQPSTSAKPAFRNVKRYN